MGVFTETKMIDAEILKEHPLNETFNPPTKEEFDELVKSLKNLGQINPIIVNKDFVVLAGHWKLKALRDVLKQKQVVVRIFEGSPKEEVQILIDDNKVRRDIKPDSWINVEKRKFMYWDKEDFFNDPLVFSVKVRNILLEYKDKVSKDFLAYLATLDHTQQILIVQELEMIFELERERFEKAKKELTKKDYDVYHGINKEHEDEVRKFTEVQGKINENKELVNLMQEKIQKYEEEIEMLKEDKIRLEEQIDELEREAENAINDEKINEEIEMLKAQLKKKDEKIDKFETILLKNQVELDNLKAENDKLKAEKDKIIAEQVKDVKERYRKMMAELEEQMKQKEEEVKEMKKKFDEELTKLTPKFYQFSNVNNYLVLLNLVKERSAVATGALIEKIEFQKKQANNGVFTEDKDDIDAILLGNKFVDETAETVYFLLSQLVSLYQNTGLFKKRIKKIVGEIFNITSVLDKSKEKN